MNASGGKGIARNIWEIRQELRVPGEKGKGGEPGEGELAAFFGGMRIHSHFRPARQGFTFLNSCKQRLSSLDVSSDTAQRLNSDRAKLVLVLFMFSPQGLTAQPETLEL